MAVKSFLVTATWLMCFIPKSLWLNFRQVKRIASFKFDNHADISIQNHRRIYRAMVCFSGHILIFLFRLEIKIGLRVNRISQYMAEQVSTKSFLVLNFVRIADISLFLFVQESFFKLCQAASTTSWSILHIYLRKTLV